MSTPNRFLGCMLVCLGLSSASPALATPPCECMYPWSLPENESGSVPTNAGIFVSWDGAIPDGFELSTKDDPPTQVPIRIQESGGLSHQVWIVPEQDLQPNTSYKLEAERNAGTSLSVSFTTGAARDQQPPQLGTVRVTAGALSGACVTHTAAVVSVMGSDDDLTPASQLLIRVHVVDPEAEPGTATVFLHPGQPVFGDSGPDPCLNNYPGAEPEKQYQATVTVLDWAGNESGASDQMAFTFRETTEESFGCGCGRAGEGLALPLLMLALLAVLRRKALPCARR